MDGMLPGDWKRLDRVIRVAVTRAIVQGVICLVLLAFILAALWGLFQWWVGYTAAMSQ